jgi:excisionase family DNA binding protein
MSRTLHHIWRGHWLDVYKPTHIDRMAQDVKNQMRQDFTMSTEIIARRTFTIEEAGQILGLGRNSAYALAKSGRLPTIRLGRRLLVPKAALDRLLENLA